MTFRPTCVIFNGKFVAQPITGVQRFARELIAETDRLISSGRWSTNLPFELAVPAGHSHALPPLKAISLRELPAAPLHLWEQVFLPFVARGALLVNLSGSAPLLKKAQVCTFHDAAIFDIPWAYSGSFGRWYRLLFRVQGRISARVLTVSQFSRERLSHHLRIQPERIGVVPNGATHLAGVSADEAAVDRLGISAGRYLLAVGSASPSKNFLALMKAFRSLQYPAARLVVVGGANSAVFAASPEAEGSVGDPGIIRSGRMNDAGLKALYRHARAFVFPSLYEGFGIPPIEAMACGCPVLASDAASMPEVCGDAAGYFDPSSQDSMRRALERALTDDAWIEGLRRAGSQRVERFTWEAAAERLLSELAGLGVVRASLPDSCRNSGRLAAAADGRRETNHG